jgi:hypothetical protein
MGLIVPSGSADSVNGLPYDFRQLSARVERLKLGLELWNDMTGLPQSGKIVIQLLRQLKRFFLFGFEGFDGRLHLRNLLGLSVKVGLLLNQSVFLLEKQGFVLLV